jgi:hypothetical protein
MKADVNQPVYPPAEARTSVLRPSAGGILFRMKPMRLACWLPLALFCLMAGCARYEYDITRPQDFAGHIGTMTDTTFQRDPLEYRWRTVDNRLVLRIYNPTDQLITLLGQRSSVVDPQQQSHPLVTQTMAPSSFIKLILPPLRPRIERTGPSIGIGVGTVIGSGRYGRRAVEPYPDWPPEPRYFTVYEDSAVYWDWDGATTVRLTLVFQRPDSSSFEHEFVIARRKM